MKTLEEKAYQIARIFTDPKAEPNVHDCVSVARIIDEAMAEARADERVKATAETYERISRHMVPRGSSES